MTPAELSSLPLTFRRHIRRADNGCLVWTGFRTAEGYGLYCDPATGKTVRAHVYAYRTLRGPLPKGTECSHLCECAGCVDLDHLAAETHRANIARRDASGHGPQGERNGRAKLTVAEVRQIKAALAVGATCGGLAREYGVSRRAVTLIRDGVNWKAV